MHAGSRWLSAMPVFPSLRVAVECALLFLVCAWCVWCVIVCQAACQHAEREGDASARGDPERSPVPSAPWSHPGGQGTGRGKPGLQRSVPSGASLNLRRSPCVATPGFQSPLHRLFVRVCTGGQACASRLTLIRLVLSLMCMCMCMCRSNKRRSVACTLRTESRCRGQGQGQGQGAR